jgi:hypothetical protein
MHFGTKSYLKNTRNHTAKHALKLLSIRNFKTSDLIRVFLGYKLIYRINQVLLGYYTNWFFNKSEPV